MSPLLSRLHESLSVCPPERTLEPPTESPSPPPRLTGQLQGLVIGITSVLVGVLFLLLLTWVLAAAFPRAAQGKAPAQPHGCLLPVRAQSATPSLMHRGPHPASPSSPSSLAPSALHGEHPSAGAWGWSGPPRFWGPLPRHRL